MVKPFGKLTRIRSLDEIVTRGGQAISVYREQKHGSHVPSEEEFLGLVDASQFGGSPIIAEGLWQKFFQNGENCFFASLKHPATTGNNYRRIFGNASADQIIRSAKEILDGRMDLLGLKGLFVGKQIDWHREPVSAKRSPLKHWKEFDELETAETGNKKIIWELNRHQHFFTLGVAYLLTNDERFAVAFVDHLESWMEQNPPAVGVNWASSLEVGFRTMSWIWAFHLFRESEAFTPDVFKKALKYLYLNGRHIEQYLSKYYSPNTHLTGEALALYYLGTQLPFLVRSKHWRKLGQEILISEIKKQVLPDGVYFEQSTWYERYTLDIFSHFSVLRSLDPAVGFDLRSEEFEERLRLGFDHAMQMTMPDGTTPLIGDDDGGRMLPLTNEASDDFRGTLALGAIICERAEYKYVAGRASEEIFWLLGPDGVTAYNELPSTESIETSKAFPDGGSFVMRDGWDDTDSVLIVDCGPVGALSGGHGHADALSIEVAIHGKTTLVDSGTYTYHESRELRDYFRSTTAHNTLTVDGRSSSEPGSTFNWKTQAKTTVRTWLPEDRFDLFEGSHDGYERLADPVTHERGILFLKNDYVIIRDLVTAKAEHEYSLNFHLADNANPVIGEAGAWVGNGEHRIYTFGDNGEWQRKESWISRDHGNKINAPFMRFVSQGQGTQEFFSFILPADPGVDPPVVTETPTPKGRAFVIRYNGYTDLFVFNDEPGQIIETGLFDTDFAYSWARLAEGDAMPHEFILARGNSLKVGGKEVLNADCGGHAAIRRYGSELYIKTANGRLKTAIDS